jgi:thiol:disulfide interchange protein
MAKHQNFHLSSHLFLTSFLAILAYGLLFSSASAQTDDVFDGNSFSSALEESHFLRVADAFIPALRWGLDRQVQLDWYIEPDYYLYRARFVYQADSTSEVTASYPAGITKFDEFFQEDLEVYYSNLLIELDIPEDTAKLYVQFQGCAEAGLCYPPTWVGFDIDTGTGSAGFMGELPSGPPVLSAGAPTTGRVAEALASSQSTDASDDGLPITLLIGFFAGLAVLAGIVVFSLKQGK